MTHVNDSYQWHGSTTRVSDKSHRLLSAAVVKQSTAGANSKRWLDRQQWSRQQGSTALANDVRRRTNATWQEWTTLVNDSCQRLLSTTSCQRHEVTRHHTTRHNMTGRDMTRHDMTRHNMTWHDMTRHDVTWRDATKLQKGCEKTNHCNATDLRLLPTTVVNEKGQRREKTDQRDTTRVNDSCTHVNDSCQRLLSTTSCQGTWGDVTRHDTTRQDRTGHDMTWRDATWLHKGREKTNHCDATSRRLLSTTLVNYARESEPTWRDKSTTLANSLWIPLGPLSILMERNTFSLNSYWNANSQLDSLQILPNSVYIPIDSYWNAISQEDSL